MLGNATVQDIKIIAYAELKDGVLHSELGFHAVDLGNWAFYVPELAIKILFARDGLVHCLHKTAPDRAALFRGDYDATPMGRYTFEDWKLTFQKSARRRAVENFLAARRLFHAGLGPEPSGLCLIRSLAYGPDRHVTETAGMIVQNIAMLPSKRNATKDEIVASGVTLDRIESCVRQQINGYVSDLNSVCGVMPVDAEAEIERMLAEFNAVVEEKTHEPVRTSL